MEHLASQELASVSRGHREERSGVHGTRRGLNSAVEPWESGGFFIHAEKDWGAFVSFLPRKDESHDCRTFTPRTALRTPSLRRYHAHARDLASRCRAARLSLRSLPGRPSLPRSARVTAPRGARRQAKRPSGSVRPRACRSDCRIERIEGCSAHRDGRQGPERRGDGRCAVEGAASRARASVSVGRRPAGPATWKSFSGSAQKRKSTGTRVTKSLLTITQSSPSTESCSATSRWCAKISMNLATAT